MVNTIEKALKDFCQCVFDVIGTDSVLDELPVCCKNFIDNNYDVFKDIKDDFNANIYHEIIFFIDDLFNKYIDDNIRNTDSTVLGFDADVVDDIMYFMRDYCEEHSVANFPEKEFTQISLLIYQKFRAFKNTILFAKNINKNETTINAMSNFMHHVTNRFSSKIEEAQESIKKVEEDVSITAEEIKAEMRTTLAESERKAHETNIAILGVFSAIVLVFNASVSFYAAAVSAFSNSSIYKVLTILLVVGIILVGAMMGLFYYLDRIRKSANSDVDKYVKKQIDSKTISADEESSTVYILDKTEGRGSVFRSLLPFLITITILIFGLLTVNNLWKKGYVENRNESVIKQYVQTSTDTDNNLEENETNETIPDSGL